MASHPRKLKDKAASAQEKGKFDKALGFYLELEKLEPADGAWPRRAADMERRRKNPAGAVQALGRAVDKYAAAGFLVKAIAVCKMILQIEPTHSETQKKLASFNDARGIPSPPARTPATTKSPVSPGLTDTPIADRPRGMSDLERSFGLGATSPRARLRPPAQAKTTTVELSPGDLELMPGATPAVGSHVVEAHDSPRKFPRQRTVPPGAPLESVHLGQVLPDARRQITVDGVDAGITEIPLDLELDLDDGEWDAPVSDPSESQAVLAARALKQKETPLFSALSASALEKTINRLDFIELQQGQTLFCQGDAGDCLYVVSEGRVAVVREGERRMKLSSLGEGEFFGEVALATEQPRSATIVAETDVEILGFSRDVMVELIDDEPQVLRLLLRFLRDRLLNNLIMTNPLFAPFGGQDRRRLANKFCFLEVDAGAVLVEQGHIADGFFVVLSGEARVVLTTAKGRRSVADLGSGDVFGEMSLLAQEPAVATVAATRKSFMLKLPAADFRQMIMTHPQVLVFVGELAEERRQALQDITDGSRRYEVAHLDIL